MNASEIRHSLPISFAVRSLYNHSFDHFRSSENCLENRQLKPTGDEKEIIANCLKKALIICSNLLTVFMILMYLSLCRLSGRWCLWCVAGSNSKTRKMFEYISPRPRATSIIIIISSYQPFFVCVCVCQFTRNGTPECARVLSSTSTMYIHVYLLLFNAVALWFRMCVCLFQSKFNATSEERRAKKGRKGEKGREDCSIKWNSKDLLVLFTFTASIQATQYLYKSILWFDSYEILTEGSGKRNMNARECNNHLVWQPEAYIPIGIAILATAWSGEWGVTMFFFVVVGVYFDNLFFLLIYLCLIQIIIMRTDNFFWTLSQRSGSIVTVDAERCNVTQVLLLCSYLRRTRLLDYSNANIMLFQMNNCAHIQRSLHKHNSRGIHNFGVHFSLVFG